MLVFFVDGLCYLVCVAIVFFISLLNLQELENNIQITKVNGKRRIIGINKCILNYTHVKKINVYV